jgi:transcriptional regulator with XRE-family HTH domain
VLPDTGTVTLSGTHVNRGYAFPNGLNSRCNQDEGYWRMDDEAVARRLQLARLGRSWTQKQLGEALGISKDAVKQMETGRGIGRDRLRASATALGISYEFLEVGIAHGTDIEVIVEGARQDGWDRAVQAMRSTLDGLTRTNGHKAATRPSKPAVVHEVPRASKRGQKGA